MKRGWLAAVALLILVTVLMVPAAGSMTGGPRPAPDMPEGPARRLALIRPLLAVRDAGADVRITADDGRILCGEVRRAGQPTPFASNGKVVVYAEDFAALRAGATHLLRHFADSIAPCFPGHAP